MEISRGSNTIQIGSSFWNQVLCTIALVYHNKLFKNVRKSTSFILKSRWNNAEQKNYKFKQTNKCTIVFSTVCKSDLIANVQTWLAS